MTLDVERRLYPRDGFASHIIGYVGEVSEDDLNQSRYAWYNPGDVVGKAGVEETYDKLLRGQDGSRDVIVDSHGREVGYLGVQHATPGTDLKLTIDNDLQRAAELALGDRNGAIVAMDPAQTVEDSGTHLAYQALTQTPSRSASTARTGTS